MIQRGLYAERNSHSDSERDEQQRAANSHPSRPDTENERDSKQQFGGGCDPGEKWNRGRRHEGIYLGRIAHKAVEVPITNVSSRVEAEAVGDTGKEGGA